MNKKQKKILFRIILSAVLTLVLYFIPVGGLIKFLLYLIPYFTIGYDILAKAFKGILNRQVFDENFLMAIATVGALAIGFFDTGDYIEAIAVMLFYQIGELFQSYAVGKSRKNIAELMDIRPDYANVECNGELTRKDPEEVSVGEIIVVQPGEKIPLDGVILSGQSSVDTSTLTGESVPRTVCEGNEVISGCINGQGLLKIRTTKEFGESTVSKILDLVENASSRKSKSENFVSKFAKIYTPAVCFSALGLMIIPPIISIIAGISANWSVWAYRALSFLVASCPCALVVSIPLSFFAGIGGASKEGILVKGSNYLESLSKVNCVVFDKTGTLTEGVFEVTDVHHNTLSREEFLEIASLAECASSHPISQSLIRAYGKTPDRSRVRDIREISGHGIIANVDEHEVAVGNSKLMESLNIDYRECHSTGTVIHMAIDKNYAGHAVISDIIKPTSSNAISSLKRIGVKKTVMLSGDRQIVAKHTGELLGIDEIYGELLPTDKVEILESLLAKQKKNSQLAFAGDGINDAPTLSRADIGIAMGALGSDAAIEAADVVLMDDNPEKITKAIKISRKCLRIVYQNIVFAISIKILALILVAFGVANMWIAVFADVGVAVIAILNATRALRVKNL